MLQYILVFMLNAQGNVAGVVAQIAPQSDNGSCSSYAQVLEVNLGSLPKGMHAEVARRCVPQEDIRAKMQRLAIRYGCKEARSALTLRCSETEAL